MKYALGFLAGVLACLGLLFAVAYRPAQSWWS